MVDEKHDTATSQDESTVARMADTISSRADLPDPTTSEVPAPAAESGPSASSGTGISVSHVDNQKESKDPSLEETRKRARSPTHEAEPKRPRNEAEADEAPKATKPLPTHYTGLSGSVLAAQMYEQISQNENSHKLDLYVWEYLYRRKLYKTAATLIEETDLPENPEVPVRLPGGLLYEYWSVFWELFSSRVGYNTRQSNVFSELLEARKRQSLQDAMKAKPTPPAETAHPTLGAEEATDPARLVQESPVPMFLPQQQAQPQQQPAPRPVIPNQPPGPSSGMSFPVQPSVLGQPLPLSNASQQPAQGRASTFPSSNVAAPMRHGQTNMSMQPMFKLAQNSSPVATPQSTNQPQPPTPSQQQPHQAVQMQQAMARAHMSQSLNVAALSQQQQQQLLMAAALRQGISLDALKSMTPQSRMALIQSVAQNMLGQNAAAQRTDPQMQARLFMQQQQNLLYMQQMQNAGKNAPPGGANAQQALFQRPQTAGTPMQGPKNGEMPNSAGAMDTSGMQGALAAQQAIAARSVMPFGRNEMQNGTPPPFASSNGIGPSSEQLSPQQRQMLVMQYQSLQNAIKNEWMKAQSMSVPSMAQQCLAMAQQMQLKAQSIASLLQANPASEHPPQHAAQGGLNTAAMLSQSSPLAQKMNLPQNAATPRPEMDMGMPFFPQAQQQAVVNGLMARGNNASTPSTPVTSQTAPQTTANKGRMNRPAPPTGHDALPPSPWQPATPHMTDSPSAAKKDKPPRRHARSTSGKTPVKPEEAPPTTKEDEVPRQSFDATGLGMPSVMDDATFGAITSSTGANAPTDDFAAMFGVSDIFDFDFDGGDAGSFAASAAPSDKKGHGE